MKSILYGLLFLLSVQSRLVMSSDDLSPFVIQSETVRDVPEGLLSPEEHRRTIYLLYTCREKETDKLLAWEDAHCPEMLDDALPRFSYNRGTVEVFPTQEVQNAWFEKGNWKVQSREPLQFQGKSYVKIRMVNEALLPLAPNLPNYLHLVATSDNKSVVAVHNPVALDLIARPDHLARCVNDLHSNRYEDQHDGRSNLLKYLRQDEEQITHALGAMETRAILIVLESLHSHYASGDELVSRVVSRLSRQVLEQLRSNPVQVNIQPEKEDVLIELRYQLSKSVHDNSLRFHCEIESAEQKAELTRADYDVYVEQMGQLLEDLPWKLDSWQKKRLGQFYFQIPSFPGISKRDLWAVVEQRLLRVGLYKAKRTSQQSFIQKESWTDDELAGLLQKASDREYFVRIKYREKLLAALHSRKNQCVKLVSQLDTRSQILILDHLTHSWHEGDLTALELVSTISPRVIERLKSKPVTVKLKVRKLAPYTGKVSYFWHYSLPSPDADRVYFSCFAEGSDGDHPDVLSALRELFSDMVCHVRSSEQLHNIDLFPGIDNREMWQIVESRLKRAGAIRDDETRSFVWTQ